MTLVPNETEQALNRQHDVYAAAREEYRKKIAEQAAEIERLRAALKPILNYPGIKDKIGSVLYDAGYAALSALEGK